MRPEYDLDYSQARPNRFSAMFKSSSFGRAATSGAESQRFVTDDKGTITGVVLSLKRYRKLIEDLHDLAVVAERRPERTISFDQMRRRLKRNGLV
jgi:hypothetical protein